MCGGAPRAEGAGRACHGNRDAGVSLLRVLEPGRPAAPSPRRSVPQAFSLASSRSSLDHSQGEQLVQPRADCSIWMRYLMFLMILERQRGDRPAFQNEEPEGEGWHTHTHAGPRRADPVVSRGTRSSP